MSVKAENLPYLEITQEVMSRIRLVNLINTEHRLSMAIYDPVTNSVLGVKDMNCYYKSHSKSDLEVILRGDDPCFSIGGVEECYPVEQTEHSSHYRLLRDMSFIMMKKTQLIRKNLNR